MPLLMEKKVLPDTCC